MFSDSIQGPEFSPCYNPPAGGTHYSVSIRSIKLLPKSVLSSHGHSYLALEETAFLIPLREVSFINNVQDIRSDVEVLAFVVQFCVG